ncbi:MAG: hypothetical protein ACI9F9_001289 [Candidatus Paceibacteria bacterium]|jgi:hypothetical protein
MNGLDPEVAAYIGDSYPHNLDYRVVRGKLRPSWKLWRRLRRIKKHYAAPLDDLLDLSSSKGFFVLDAALKLSCRRAVGIDVHEPDLQASRAVAEHLGLNQVQFKQQTLDECALSISDAGGPFRTVLLINTYPYLFLGSDRSDSHIPDHRELFERLAKVTEDRLVFSNRIHFEALPRHIQARAKSLNLEAAYDPVAIRKAAEMFFQLDEQRPLGKIPLWVLRKRA